jgi:SAM-dependent methyltransferase
VNDGFKELEVAGWREPGRGDAYDAVVGRVTARVAEPLLDAVGVRACTSLLDVATGTGHVAGAAAARGAHGVGVDISEEMLARARRLYDGVEFALSDAEELAFEDDAFDVAVAAFLLHHVPSPERVVSELARVARRVAVAQWDAAERARLIGLLTDAIAAARVEPPTGRPAGPSRERLARDEELRCLFEGERDSPRSGSTPSPSSSRCAAPTSCGRLGGSINTRATVLAQPPDVRQRIRDELARLVDPHRREDGIDVPVSVRIASGRRG